MRTKIQFAILLLALGAMFSLFEPWLANAEEIPNPIGSKTFQQVIERLVDFANLLLAPLSTFMVLLAGFFYMTGGGNPEKIKTAHKTLVWALVGIAIVLLANSASFIIKEVLSTK